MLNVLTDTPSIANQFLIELRSKSVQKDRLRFRRNLERIGEILAVEISKTLEYIPQEIETSLGVSHSFKLAEQPVIGTIIRSGLPMHQGILNIFDGADSAFIAAYRKIKKSGAFEIRKDYISLPNLDNKTLIMCDPLVATGQSMVLACKEILATYDIKELHIAIAIASEEGINHLRAYLPNAYIWVGDVDAELTSKSFIVPGLGDVGDLSFGEKSE